MRRTLNILVVLSAALAIVACNDATKPTEEPKQQATSFKATASSTMVATVGTTTISAEELLAEAQRHGVPPTKSAMSSLLQALVDKHAAVDKIKELGLDKDPEFASKYQQLALTTLQAKYQQELSDLMKISEQEVESYYENNLDKFTQPERIRLELIEIASRYGSDPKEAETKAKSIWQQLQDTASDNQVDLFHQLAAKHSDHRASRYRGGDIGYILNKDNERWPKPLVEKAFSMKVGEQAMIESAPGHHYIISVVERLPAYTNTLADSSRKITHILGAQKLQQLKATISAKIREGMPIEIHEARLESLNLDSPLPNRRQGPPGPALN